MTVWNYVVTAIKPTAVTHSCVGNFTNPQHLNLIVAKCNRLEIYLFKERRIQCMLDVPIYGRIATLELFRPHGEAQDVLFLATETYKFCVLQWDPESSELITRAMGDASDQTGQPADNGQIGIIDPDCRLIGFHLYDGLFKVIPFDNNGQLMEAFSIRLEEVDVLDIKFLYGCTKPTITVLYQDHEKACHVKTYVVSVKDKALIEGPWPQTNVGFGADLLLPVSPPLGGVFIIGGKSIYYRSTNISTARPLGTFITTAYGRGDSFRYLLSDHDGVIYLLSLFHKEQRFNGFNIGRLGETSIASTISHIVNGILFVGSRCGDSQLIKLNVSKNAEGSYVEILERHVNLGPIFDFCVLDLERQGQGQVVTCSGMKKDGSLRIVRNGIGINDQVSLKLEDIKGMWSLKSSIDEAFDTFLVVSFIGETRIFVMSLEDELDVTEIEGFVSHVQTLFCHNAVYNQLVQVTSNSVRLVNSTTRELRNEWHPPPGFTVNVATANASQILLATGGGHLIYLEIGDGTMTEVKHTQLEHEASCLDINPIGDKPNYSHLAVVGMWTKTSVKIFELPGLTLITTEQLAGEINPRSVLLCAFEGISYLLCGLGDGHLLNFQLDISSGELRDRKKVSLGTQPITLRTFSSKSATHVFATSDRPAVVYSKNKKLLYSNVNRKEVSHMCPFNFAASPDSLALAREDELTIGTIDEIQKFHIRNIPMGEHVRRICHQEQTRTLAICSMRLNAQKAEMHFIHLLDDQTFASLSSYPLRGLEYACSILSCSFTNDKNVYYCVGTADVIPWGRSDPSTGRILVFKAEDGKLQLVTEKDTEGAVFSLNAFNGKLLAGIYKKIQLYKWVLRDDDTRELQFECESGGRVQALYVQTRGDFIVVGDLILSITLLIYNQETCAIEERACERSGYWMSAVEILDDDIYLGAENHFNLFTVRKNNDETGHLEVVGQYHTGEHVHRFRHGSLAMRRPDLEISKIQTILFGTVSGAIGVIASVPQELYRFLEKLQTSLRKVIKGVGGLSHKKWRSFNKEMRIAEAKNFVDGGLIESVLSLSRSRIEEMLKNNDVVQLNMEMITAEARNFVDEEWTEYCEGFVHEDIKMLMDCSTSKIEEMRSRFPKYKKQKKEEIEAKNFVDGDLIESFLDLSRSKMEEISKAMDVEVDELYMIVEELTRLH